MSYMYTLKFFSWGYMGHIFLVLVLKSMTAILESILNSTELTEDIQSSSGLDFLGNDLTTAMIATGDRMNSRLSSTTVSTVVTTTVSTVLGMSEAGVLKFSSILRTYVMPAIGLLGLIGNCLGAGVLRMQAKQQKLSIFWYLLALTSIDVLFLACAVIDGIPFNVQTFDKELSKYLIAHFRLGLSYIDVNCIHTARYFVVVMSCERLISVVRPLHVKNTWFAKHPKRISLACIIFNAIFLLPVPLNATVVLTDSGNTTDYAFTFKNYENFMAPWWVAEAVIHSFIPMAILVPVNIALPIFINRASRKLRASRNASQQESSSQQGKVTATVLVITINYIILSIPLVAAKWFQFISPEFNLHGRYRLVFWFFADVGKCLAYVNAANDFPIFFLVSRNYRAVFKNMYCGKCSGKSAKKHSDRSSTIRPGISKISAPGGGHETLSSTMSSQTVCQNWKIVCICLSLKYLYAYL